MSAGRRAFRTGAGGAALLALALWGCGGRVHPRLVVTEPEPFPVSVPRVPPAAPVTDSPPAAVVGTPTAVTTVTGVGATTGAHIPDPDKQELIRRARLDRMVVGLASGGPGSARAALADAASSKLAELGLRVLDLGAVRRYDAPSSDYAAAAGEDGIDVLMVLWGTSRQADKFGNFFSYEARCRGKMLDPIDGASLASTEILKRGKRALDSGDAERSSLEAGGEELVKYLTDEMVRKVEQGGHVMRVVLTNVRSSEEVDKIRVYLQSRPGVAEAKLVSWSKGSRRARLLVRMHPGTKGNLAAYLETVPGLRIEVTDVSPRDVSGEKKDEEKRGRPRR